jgi:UDP:flavonoid glycosyltransferase YjiC (YdhE family)
LTPWRENDESPFVNRILVATHASAGHLNPTTGLCLHLRDKGAATTLLVVGATDLPAARRAALAGVDVHCFSSGRTSEAAEYRQKANAEITSLESFHEDVPALRTKIRDLKPDFVAVDGFLPNAIAACHLEGVPYSLYFLGIDGLIPKPDLPAPLAALADLHRAFYARYSVPWFEDAPSPRSPRLNLVLSAQEVVREQAALAGLEVAGFPKWEGVRGDEPPFDWNRLPAGRPFVYASFGTMLQPRRELAETVAAARRVRIPVLVSAGELADSLSEAADEYVIVEKYVPQREVLKRALGVITHVGAQSVAEALGVATPLILIPMAGEQLVLAPYVERTGAGLHVSQEDATENRIASAILRLTRPNNALKQSAKRIAESCTRDGLEVAAGRILAVARGT